MKTIIRYEVILILFVMMISSLISSAQPFVDPLNVKYQYFPQESYTDDVKNNMSSSLYEATILLPMELKNKDLVLVNADFTEMNFSCSGNSSLNTKLYSTSFAVGYEHGWKKSKWRTMVMFIPKINSDFKSNTSDALQMGGVVLANYKKNDHLKYHFGMYYNREFFGDYMIPLLGIEWKINTRLNLFGDLPANMNLEYKYSKKIYVGAAFQSVISSYRLNHGNYVREGDNVFGHNQLKVYLNYYLTDHVVLYAETGQTFYRMYNLYDRNNNPLATNSVFHKSDDGMFYTAGLAYRIRLD